MRSDSQSVLLLAAGAVFSVLPILLFFGFTQKYFIEGALKGAVKG